MKRNGLNIFTLMLICIWALTPVIVMAQGLVINEIMASNASTIQDEDGDYEDWFEIYNGTNQTVNLQGYKISDTPSNPGRWTFPDITLAPGDHLLVFASGKNRINGSYLHTNFSISIEGEYLLLSDPNHNILDYLQPIQLTTDNSYGRLTDGADSLVFFSGSTPGYSNNGQPLFQTYPDTILLSHDQGFYSESFYLHIGNTLENAIVRFTINGSEPTPNSPLFPDSLLIADREGDENYFSLIRTNPETTPSFYRWHLPSEHIFKGSVIKIRSFINDSAVSDIITANYWVHPEISTRYKLPIVSIVTDSLNLFDYETGIYVPGLYHDLNPSWAWVWGTGNYHQRGDDWERPANLAFFESDGQLAFQQDVGIRIHGDGSRALPQKTLRIYARNAYGKNSMDYAYFPETGVNSYRRILLRNSGQDFYTTMLTDALTHRLVEHLDLEAQSVRPAVVFINGEFWGIHHIRDRIDKYYFAYRRGANPDRVDYLENAGTVIEGDNHDYLELKNFIRDFGLENDIYYLQVAEQIDIDNYIDYTIAKQYIAVFDWPGNNMEYWRKQEPGSKWRWVFFDNDQCMVNYNFNSLEHSTVEGNTGWPNPDWSTFLFRNLLKNESFKQKYLDRWEYHLLNTFTTDRINKELDSLLFEIEHLMEEQIARWNYPLSYNRWVSEVYEIREFALKRPCHMLYHLINFFEITDTTYAVGVCDTIHAVGFPELVFSNQNFKLWPNPATYQLEVKLNYEISSISHMAIYDIYGRKVKDVELIQSPYVRRVVIPLDEMASGTYIMRIDAGKEVLHKKFIINQNHKY